MSLRVGIKGGGRGGGRLCHVCVVSAPVPLSVSVPVSVSVYVCVSGGRCWLVTTLWALQTGAHWP